MKLYAKIKNEKGNQEGLGGNEHLDIDIMVGNLIMASYTLRKGESPEKDSEEAWVLVDQDDEVVQWLPLKQKGQMTQSE